MLKATEYAVKELVESVILKNPEVDGVNYIEVTDQVTHGDTTIYNIGAFVEYNGGGVERKEFSISIEIKERKFL